MTYYKSRISEKYDDLFENPHYYIFVYNLNGVVLDVNDLILKNFGYSYDEVVNKNFKDFLNKEDFIKAFETISEIRRTGKFPSANIYRIKKKDGEYRDVQIMGIPLKENQEIYAIMAIGTDITNFKLSEQKLKESEEKFRLITERSFTGILIVQDNIIKFANEAMLNLLEFTEGEFINQDPLEFMKMIHPTDRPHVLQRFQDLIQQKSEITKSYFYRINTKSGKVKWVNSFSKIVKINHSWLILAIFLDITEKMDAEQKLIDSEQQYRNMINYLDVGFFNVSLDGTVINHNPAFNKIFGIDPKKDLRGTISFNFWESNDDRNQFIEALKINGYVQNYIVPAKKFNGERIIVLGNTHLVYNKEGVPIASEGTFIDVTEKIELEYQLKLSEEKYRKAYEHENFYKDLFAHDMNNILQNMLMSLELGQLKLKEAKENEEYITLLNKIQEQIDRGTSLVKNVLKFSQLDESNENLTLINVLATLNKVIRNYVERSELKTIDIELISSKEEFNILANEFLEDVFENIINNAIKHNNNKNIKILVKITQKEVDNNKILQIEFIDNGIGIPDSKKNSLFNRGIKENRTISGMGLGLTLVKQILNAYNAEIKIENNVPNDITKGSNFILTFPLEAENA